MALFWLLVLLVGMLFAALIDPSAFFHVGLVFVALLIFFWPEREKL